MKSKVYKLDGKLFRYNFDRCTVEYIAKASAEDMKDEAEWILKHGSPLYGIDHDGYMVLDSIGLSRENWKDREARDEYLSAWSMDLDAESSALVDSFVKYELPYLV